MKKEWIAVTLAIVVIALFLGSRFLVSSKNENQNSNQTVSADQTNNNNQVASTDQATSTDQTASQTTNSNKNINNNMNKNNQTSGGLIVKDVVVGTGAEAKDGDLVSVEYTGKFANGKVFDSTDSHGGQPLPFTLGTGQVIPGWDQGVLGMKVGGERTLVIPPALGYGANGFPPVIPANATLYFDVKLVGVQVQ